MLRAYAVADVREVEDAAMAVLPEGELMARAARGLADVVRERLQQRRGSRASGCSSGAVRASSRSSGPGTTAGTPCMPCPCSPARACTVPP